MNEAGAPCESDIECRRGACGIEFVDGVSMNDTVCCPDGKFLGCCIGKLQVGDTCSHDADCRSGFCVFGECTEHVSPGERCDSDNDCSRLFSTSIGPPLCACAVEWIDGVSENKTDTVCCPRHTTVTTEDGTRYCTLDGQFRDDCSSDVECISGECAVDPNLPERTMCCEPKSPFFTESNHHVQIIDGVEYCQLLAGDPCDDDLQCITSRCTPEGVCQETFFCFPTQATVQVEGRGTVKMRDLEIGDEVQIKEDTYEPIYGFAHRNHDIEASSYLEVVTSTSKRLRVSSEHLVFIDAEKPVPAGALRVGDLVATANDMTFDTIKSIHTRVVGIGAYAPLTPSGYLVVDGIRVSSFVSLQSSATLHVGGLDTGLSYHSLSHWFELPHRLLCLRVLDCRGEQYVNESGISKRLAIPYASVGWFLQQTFVSQMILFIPVMAAMFLLALPGCSLLALILAFSVACRGHKKEDPFYQDTKHL